MTAACPNNHICSGGPAQGPCQSRNGAALESSFEPLGKVVLGQTEDSEDWFCFFTGHVIMNQAHSFSKAPFVNS